MLPTLYFPRKKVIHTLDFLYAWRWDRALRELLEPLVSNTGAVRYFLLRQGVRGPFHQLVCAFQQVHALSLAKCYPECKQNVTQSTCDNTQLWVDVITIMLRRGWQLSAVPPARS
jgi:hypothetical protein